MANTESELQQQIVEATQQLLGLERTRDERQSQIAELETARRKHMVAARARRDPKAQAESERLALKIEGVRREKCDDELAIDELSKHKDSLEEDLRVLQWQALCNRVRSGIRSRLRSDLPQQISECAKRLRALCEELQASDEQITHELTEFDPYLYPAGRSISALTVTRGELLLCSLGKNVPNMLSWQWQEVLGKRDLAVVEAGVLQDVLKKIDELEEQGPTRAPQRRTESVRELTTD